MITIITASWGNTDKTSAIVNTVERNHKAISERDTPQEWADFLTWMAQGNVPRALEDGASFRAHQQRAAERNALRHSAEIKLAALGITPEELRAFMDEIT